MEIVHYALSVFLLHIIAGEMWRLRKQQDGSEVAELLGDPPFGTVFENRFGDRRKFIRSRNGVAIFWNLDRDGDLVGISILSVWQIKLYKLKRVHEFAGSESEVDLD